MFRASVYRYPRGGKLFFFCHENKDEELFLDGELIIAITTCSCASIDYCSLRQYDRTQRTVIQTQPANQLAPKFGNGLAPKTNRPNSWTGADENTHFCFARHIYITRIRRMGSHVNRKNMDLIYCLYSVFDSIDYNYCCSSLNSRF